MRVILAPGIGFGPGKMALLQQIKATGSIAAAGRTLGMSYKRAWYLVEAMNGHFQQPLVVSSKGGRSGGGALLTPLGQSVLASLEEIQHVATSSTAPILRRLQRKVATDIPK